MINKERIRARLANIANKNQTTSWWKCPKQGKATVRLFPYPYSSDGDPFLEYFYHFNIGKDYFLCPLKNGVSDRCLACEVAADMYNSDKPSENEMSKKIYARSRYFGTIVDRSDETLTAKYWGFSQSLLIKFSTWLEEDGGDYENFMDLQEGLDLVVELENTPGKQFAAVTAQPKRRESPLAKSKEDLDAIIKSVKPAKEVFVFLKPEEIDKKIDDWVNSLDGGSTDEADDVSEGTVKGKPDVQETKPRNKTVGKSVEEVFEQNFPDA